MAREETLDEFLRSLKISLNTAALYSKDHPYLLKAVEDLKKKIDSILQFLNPIKLDVSVSELFLNGQKCPNTVIIEDIINILHQRKIKTIEIGGGVTREGLASLIGSLSLRQKEIFRSGGIGKILDREKISSIKVEELDYSLLLKGEGEEVKDIWIYLLQEAVQSQDEEKIGNLADNFSKFITKFKFKDFLDDAQLEKNITGFLDYLKGSQRDKSKKCSQELFKIFMQEKGLSGLKDADKITPFIKNLEGTDLADSILEQLSIGRSFDKLTFSLFSQLIDKKKHEEIASAIAEKLKNADYLKGRAHIMKQVQELFSLPSNPNVSEIYRNTLSSLLGNISFLEDRFVLDRTQLRLNFRSLLIDLFIREEEEDKINLILANLLPELEEVIKNKEWKYLRYFLEALNKKRKVHQALEQNFKQIDQKLSSSLEDFVWSDDIPEELGDILSQLQASLRSPDYYINKIFYEKKINPFALGLYLKFFPADTAFFCEKLKQERADNRFILKIIEALKPIKNPVTIQIYKYIFQVSNELVKLEVLRAMQDLSDSGAEPLLEGLAAGSAYLKKEGMLILMNNDLYVRKLLELFLEKPSPLGRKNKLIIENISIIQELGLREAAKLLTPLTKRKFFWNRALRVKAQEALNKWHDRKY